MCGGTEYLHNGEKIRVYFPMPDAKLPVRTKQGATTLVTWGRKKEQAGYSPAGGWARLESIKNGVWEKYNPIPVKIPVLRFMEKDRQKVSHWFDLPDHSFLQGLLINDQEQSRVYVVTTQPTDKNAIHDRWPRIISEEDEK